MKRFLLLFIILLLPFVTAENYSFSYPPGIYDEQIEVNHLDAKTLILSIMPEKGNQANDWVWFVPKEKTIIIENYDRKEDVNLRFNIPAGADVGSYNIVINAVNQDGVLIQTYNIEINIISPFLENIKGIFLYEVNFIYFTLNIFTIIIFLLGIVLSIGLLLKIKDFFKEDE